MTTEHTDAAFDPTKPFTMRDGREVPDLRWVLDGGYWTSAVIKRSWYSSGRFILYQETPDDLVNITVPEPAEPNAFHTEDFLDLRDQLLNGSEQTIKAALSNSYNVVLAALTLARRTVEAESRLAALQKEGDEHNLATVTADTGQNTGKEERERLYKLMWDHTLTLPVGERGRWVEPMGVVRRGRFLTNEEKLQNLADGLDMDVSDFRLVLSRTSDALDRAPAPPSSITSEGESLRQQVRDPKDTLSAFTVIKRAAQAENEPEKQKTLAATLEPRDAVPDIREAVAALAARCWRRNQRGVDGGCPCKGRCEEDWTSVWPEDVADMQAALKAAARVRAAKRSRSKGEAERTISVHDYVAEYDHREPDYTPSDGERAMIEDAIEGYLAACEAARVIATRGGNAEPDVSEAEVEAALQVINSVTMVARRWVRAALEEAARARARTSEGDR